MNLRNTNILASCFMVMLMVAISVGCSTLSKMPRKTQYTLAYQAMGITLEVAKPQILSMCAEGVFDEVDCAKATKAYNQAVTSYKLLGEAVDALIVTGDEVTVQDLLLQLQALLGVVNQYLATQ